MAIVNRIAQLMPPQWPRVLRVVVCRVCGMAGRGSLNVPARDAPGLNCLTMWKRRGNTETYAGHMCTRCAWDLVHANPPRAWIDWPNVVVCEDTSEPRRVPR